MTESKPLLDDFEKQYPFIKGELFRASGEVILNRIIGETRAGKWNFDVVMVGEFDVLMGAKLLAPYKSPESKNFIADFVNPNGYWCAVYVNYRTIGYNSKLVAEKDAPKQWGRLARPEMARQNFARRRRLRLVRRSGEVLGQRESAKIYESTGEARHPMA